MVCHTCFHCRGFWSENPIHASAKRFVGADQVVASHTDGKLGLEPTHRASGSRRFADKMGIPKAPVQIGTLNVRCVYRSAGRFCQSFQNALLVAVNYFTLNFHNHSTLPSLVNRGVIQIRINDTLRIARPPAFASGNRRNQLMKQLAKDRGVMGQFIGDKQWLGRCAISKIPQHTPGIVQFAPSNPECDQQPCGGVDCRPDPGSSVLVLDVFWIVRTFLFFTKVHSSSNWASVRCSDFSKSESTRAQCSPARRITRLTVSLSMPSNRAVALTPTPSAAWWMICWIFSGGRCNPNSALDRLAAKRWPQVRQYNKSRLLSLPYLARKAMFPCPRKPWSWHFSFGQKNCSKSLMDRLCCYA